MAHSRHYLRIKVSNGTRSILEKHGVLLSYIGGGESTIDLPIGCSIITPKGHDKKLVFLIVDQTGKTIADGIWGVQENAFIVTAW